MIKDVFIKVNGIKKLVGSIKGDEFRKVIKNQSQIYHNTNAVGIDEEVWNTIIKEECEWFLVYMKKEDVLYKARISELDLKKDYKNFKPHRLQVLFKLKHFKKLERKTF